MNLKGRHLLTLKDFTPEEIRYLLNLSEKLKKKKISGEIGRLLERKNIVLLFDKTSTRTRCAFEVAAFDEGAQVTFLTNSQMGQKESIEDTAKVLGRFYDGIEFRGFKQETIVDLAKHAGVPVWNGLTDRYHPTQVLADMLTIQEKLGSLKNKKLVFVGDARNNMGNSLMIGCAKLGMNFVAIAPESLFPEEHLTKEMKALCVETGGSIELTSNINFGVKGADVIYTDVWVSMGEEDQMAERIALLEPYRVDMAMIQASGKESVLFLHCLPAFHDLKTEVAKDVYKRFGLKEMEVSDRVFRSSYSAVFDQAENRMHAIKAVICATILGEIKMK